MKLVLFLLFFFSVDVLVAQSTTSQFFKLSCAEKCWTLLHPFKAKKAFQITQEARQLTRHVQSEHLLDSFTHGGSLDAFRHSFWMARLAQSIGPRAARSLGKAHEKGNYRAFKKGKTEDGMLQDATAVEMDLYNNKQGILAGMVNRKASSFILMNYLLESIHAGNFKMLKRDSLGQLCTCENMPVILENRTKNEWKLPFCLIPSR